MTVNEFYEKYGERIKRTLIGTCDLDYCEASQVLLQTLAAVPEKDLRDRVAFDEPNPGSKYPAYPFVLGIAFQLADLARVRCWAPAGMGVWDQVSFSN